MTQYAAEFEVPDAAKARDALTAARGSESGWTARGNGVRLVVSFPADDNYAARSKALLAQAVLDKADHPVKSARIRRGHGMFAGPWFDLNEA